MQDTVSPLPTSSAANTSNQEARHARHQTMIENHREDKHARRERHRAGWHKAGHKASGIPVVLI